MTSCPGCAREITTNGRFCSWCAAPLDATSAETAVVGSVGRAGVRLTSSSVDEGRFLPGTVLAGRYRIAGLLGRGGMGEVYRATDLTLGQAVALKFLPESTAQDDRALARFYNEVRTARQVTHPNVCRVYDIGEVNGQTFISMEYIDGEDLGSLLRRIGHLPADKAVETARKLCAGLAAAHEKGVLHRDLKPANVMIDGRGQVIVMDFGLAGLSEDTHIDIRSGTPAYMAPEQLAGKEVSARSDIYALGLLLYEIFTGKRAFEASSVVELMEMQGRGAPAAKDLDPAVQRAIERCLQPDPRNRPSSALAVAAAMPGGDVLAAALAAGETPSPDEVAAAGETEGLPPKVALGWLAAAVAGAVVAGVLGAQMCITSKVALDAPPDSLARDSRRMLAGFGYTAKPADRTWGFEYNGDYRTYLKSHPDAARARWREPQSGFPPLIDFWYREGRQPIVPARGFNIGVNYSDPPMELSGMVRLKTGPEGNLLALEAVPDQVETTAQTAAPFDWSALFRAAGLDFSRFASTEPQWTPLASWDARAAWKGPSPGGGPEVRVEAAAWRGRPVFLQIVGPWSVAERSQPPSPYADPPAVLAFVYISLFVACVIAWINVRAGRSDLHGAVTIGLIFFVCQSMARLLDERHVASFQEISLFWRVVGLALLNGVLMWAYYAALEPWVRRIWPQTIISWSRFTTKGMRDPLVGRDLLYGSAMGAIWVVLEMAQMAIHGAGTEPILPGHLSAMLGTRESASAMLTALTNGLSTALLLFFLFFVIRALLRKQWLAAGVFVLLVTSLFTFGTDYPAVDWPANALFAALYAAAFLRFGVLALVVAGAVEEFLTVAPRTLDFSAWYAAVGMVPVVLVALIALYGFRTALAGRKLF